MSSDSWAVACNAKRARIIREIAFIVILEYDITSKRVLFDIYNTLDNRKSAKFQLSTYFPTSYINTCRGSLSFDLKQNCMLNIEC